MAAFSTGFLLRHLQKVKLIKQVIKFGSKQYYF